LSITRLRVRRCVKQRRRRLERLPDRVIQRDSSEYRSHGTRNLRIDAGRRTSFSFQRAPAVASIGRQPCESPHETPDCQPFSWVTGRMASCFRPLAGRTFSGSHLRDALERASRGRFSVPRPPHVVAQPEDLAVIRHPGLSASYVSRRSSGARCRTHVRITSSNCMLGSCRGACQVPQQSPPRPPRGGHLREAETLYRAMSYEPVSRTGPSPSRTAAARSAACRRAESPRRRCRSSAARARRRAASRRARPHPGAGDGAPHPCWLRIQPARSPRRLRLRWRRG
jgi:hypothetical protein